MKTFALHLLGCISMALLLVIIFGILMPMLATVASDTLAILGVLGLIGLAVGAVLLVKHILSFDYHRDIKK